MGKQGTSRAARSPSLDLDDGALGASLDSLDEIPLRHARDLVGQARL